MWLGIWACSSPQNIQDFKTSPTLLEEGKDYILFINYLIELKNDQPTATYHSHMIKEGKLKPSGIKYMPDQSFMLQQLNEEAVVLDSINLENPLIKNVEFADENGYLQNKTLYQENASLSLRLQLNLAAKSILLLYKNPDQSTSILHKLEL